MTLTDLQRKAVHDLVVKKDVGARDLLTKDAYDHLGIYGLSADGVLDSEDRVPLIKTDAEAAETYRRLRQFLDDEVRTGLSRIEAVEKLVKEIAFTHLNRLVAFKMMEARKLIRGTLDKGPNSNGFKIYLVEHPEEMELNQRDADAAYRHFLLWQAGQIAREMAVLFDPETLPSRLFPSPAALNTLIAALNQPELEPCWMAEETIGWVYQYFNEREKAEVFEGLKAKRKIRRQDIPAATQLFTPNWIVRFLVQNTLGRTWVQMHPDTRLLNTEILNYLVPLQGDVPAEPLRPVREITLLDPACGTMHFGLVAFDLFAAMYQEEIDRAGEEGWLAAPSLSDKNDIAAAIIADNIYGIDIDLRAVQLSALALYLKAKALNKNARITDSHLACADVLPLNGARLGTFLREMKFSPLVEKLIRTLWERLRDVNQFGSLLRLEREFNDVMAGYRKTPMLARLESGFDVDINMSQDEFWGLLFTQIIQGLDEFARQQAETGVDMRFFTGEAVKGIRLLDVMLRRYDVVVANPPYSGKRNLNATLGSFLEDQYPDTKGDLYAAFIERCAELLEDGGRVGILSIHSFMFLSSYEKMRKTVMNTMTIETINHMGTRTFMDLSNPNAQGFVGFILHASKPTPQTMVNAIRLTNAAGGDGKREGMEHAIETGENIYHLAQYRLDAIPGTPWVYWIREKIRELFIKMPKLGDIAQPRQGLATADNFRFLRYWWEVGMEQVGFGCRNRTEATASSKGWFPCMKGGSYRKWYGNQEYVVRWKNDGIEMKTFVTERYGNWSKRIASANYQFLEGVTWTHTTNIGLSVRYMPHGFICNVEGMAAYPIEQTIDNLHLLGVMNSTLSNNIIGMLNPTIHYGGREIQDLPMPLLSQQSLGIFDQTIDRAIFLRIFEAFSDEATFDFIAPLPWHTGLDDAAQAQSRLTTLERQIDEEVYTLYGIAGEDRKAIESELAGGSFTAEETGDETAPTEDAGEDISESPLTREELAVRWISYAVSVVLGRFSPGTGGALGRAVYKKADFAIGSLPTPDDAEFDLLVGPASCFAFVDAEGGRHVFSAETEAALRSLTVPDGITVLDETHSRDLVLLVEKALIFMHGDDFALDIINEGAAGDLGKFLSRKFFTDWHMKWYRKRPIYWPLQTSDRSYGFVVFHERVSQFMLYDLARHYLDQRINRVRNEMSDLESQRSSTTGGVLGRLNKSIQNRADMLEALDVFLKTIERLANDGYQPGANWIDDGVILRLAPLWELMPLWKAEPKKHWDKLVAGDFDWSHIAMQYWPERVREKCKTNRSFAIAHGLEALLEGS